MKLFAAALATTGALAVKITENNCFDGQGAKHLEECFGMYLNLCDEFEMQGPSTCNIIAFNNVQMDWLSSQV